MSPSRRRFAAACVALLLTASAASAAGLYTLDQAHSYIGFSVRHMTIATVRGQFDDVAGELHFDDEDPTRSRVEVRIQAASIDTGNERRDTHLRSDDFFDAETHPLITFRSKTIEAQGDGSYLVTGDLTIRGTTKEVQLPVTVAGPISTGDVLRLGIEGELTIDRQEFGVGWNRILDTGGLVVSDEVKLTITVEATR